MKIQYLLLTRFSSKIELTIDVKSKIKTILPVDSCCSIYSRSKMNSTEFMVLLTIDNNLNFCLRDLKNIQDNIKRNLSKLLITDIKMEVIEFEKSVKSNKKNIIDSKYLQLRHIEVPLNVYDEYLEWREKSIFSHVSKQDKIDYFISFHSLISAEPGVMFLSGFSCPVEEYVSIFNTPEYLHIIKEAGDRFISGGDKGLYTEIYQLV